MSRTQSLRMALISCAGTVLWLAACSGDNPTPAPASTPAATFSLPGAAPAPASLAGSTPAPAVPATVAGPPTAPTPTRPAQVVTVTPTIDPQTFAGKDGICATVVALSLDKLAAAQSSFGLSKALGVQQPVMRGYKADARPVQASFLCNGGRISWTVNWLSDSARLGWVVSSFADDTGPSLESGLKLGLSTYPEPQPSQRKTLPGQGLVGLDRVSTALSDKGYKPDTRILSVTLSASPTPARYVLVLDQNQPQLSVDAATGTFNG